MSGFEHFNVYEDIPNNYFLSQVKKKLVVINQMYV